MSGYIGNTPVPQATQSRESFTATSGQTTFATIGYTVGFLDVYLNGVHLLNGTDYTATNGSDVVLTTGAASGDILEVISYSTYEVNNQNYTGDLTVDTDVLVVDSTNDRVGVNKASPAFPLDVTGAIATDTGIYLGGTGSANLLDDYEEGTWTPRIADHSTGSTLVSAGDYSGTYTKIGNVVTLRCVIGATASLSTGTVAIWDLPFVVANNQSAYAPGACLTRQVNLNGGSYIVMEPTKGASKCLPLIVVSGTSSTTATVTNALCGSAITLNFTLTYLTN